MAVVFLGVFIGFSSSFSLSFFAAKRIPLEEEKLDRKSIVFLAFTLSVVSSSPRKKKAALFARFIKNGTNGRPPVVPRPRLSSESKEVACIFRSRERRLCVRFFTHENTTKKERKKENNTTNTRNGDDIYDSLSRSAARAFAISRDSFLLATTLCDEETPFYFLRLYTTTLCDETTIRYKYQKEQAKRFLLSLGSTAWYIVSDQKSTNRSRIGFTRTGVESSPPSGYKSKAPRFSFSFH